MKLYITIICCFLLFINAKSQSIEKVKAKDAFEAIYHRDTISTIIIDGRSNEMYAEKHIEGAINIDAFGDLVEEELKKYLEAEKIIVYCTNHKRADLIIEKLEEIRYNKKIIFITDGINAWISSGFKTVSN
jgi:rhodanese-related sulfurtransferase